MGVHNNLKFAKKPGAFFDKMKLPVLIIPILTLATFAFYGCQSVPHQANSNKGFDHDIIKLEFSPATLPGGSRSESTWSESGYIIHAPLHKTGQHIMGSESASSWRTPLSRGDYIAVNGTDCLSFGRYSFQDGFLERKDGKSFTPKSVDLAEYSTVYPVPIEIRFYATTANGAVTTYTFVTDGVIDGPGGKEDFQTFIFPESFTDIKKLSWASNGCCMDNFVIESDK